MMAISEKVQAARKAAQKKRLKAKGKDNYPEFYASQPIQKVKAKQNEEIRKAKQEALDAYEDLLVAEIDGEGLEAAQEAAHVAAMVVQRLEAAKRVRPGASLSAAGGIS